MFFRLLFLSVSSLLFSFLFLRLLFFSFLIFLLSHFSLLLYLFFSLNLFLSFFFSLPPLLLNLQSRSLISPSSLYSSVPLLLFTHLSRPIPRLFLVCHLSYLFLLSSRSSIFPYFLSFPSFPHVFTFLSFSIFPSLFCFFLLYRRPSLP